MRIPQERIDQVFAAQCIKDDKMAESIFYYWQDNQDKVIFISTAAFIPTDIWELSKNWKH